MFSSSSDDDNDERKIIKIKGDVKENAIIIESDESTISEDDNIPLSNLLKKDNKEYYIPFYKVTPDNEIIPNITILLKQFLNKYLNLSKNNNIIASNNEE